MYLCRHSKYEKYNALIDTCYRNSSTDKDEATSDIPRFGCQNLKNQ